ncbi:MAG: hypothetical protein QXJ06_03590 [Candidatus Aenigmatarchaeota archaeon]
MINNRKRYILLLTAIVFFVISLFARTGNEIIATAEDYRNHEWICNIQNARDENKDNNVDTNNYKYPFLPQGQPYKEYGSDVPRISIGQYTGIAYGWGLRETREVFNEKLGKIKSDGSGYLAGWIGPPDDKLYQSNFWEKYTGIDCSGFVANCAGIPILSRSNSYNIWHPGVVHLMAEYFTDLINWDELKKGDILIKREVIIKSDGSQEIREHVAIAKETPTLGNTIKVIEAAPKYRDENGEIKYRTKVDESIYEKKADGKIYRCDGGSGYNPRRFSVPYLKKVKIYQGKWENGVPEHELKYSAEWIETEEGRTKTVTVNKSVEEGEIYFVLEFSKGMAVKTDYGADWEDITVRYRNNSVFDIQPVASGLYNDNFFNEYQVINKGWGKQVEVDIGEVYTRWIGKSEIKDRMGEVTLEISARSLMQDELDSNPGTKAERTEKIIIN